MFIDNKARRKIHNCRFFINVLHRPRILYRCLVPGVTLLLVVRENCSYLSFKKTRFNCKDKVYLSGRAHCNIMSKSTHLHLVV